MAATGKKSKKAKWIPASITDIIAEPTTIPAANNWADSVDDEPTETSYGGYSSRPRAPVVLPSASRAARGGMAVDDESIPKRPPYIAHISNLPYDVDESAISELFAGLKIINLRLPRDSDRLKGYGYVDFEDRESLIDAMNMADLTIGGRRIRIGVSTQENDRRMGRGGRNDTREYDPERTMGDWRSGPRAAPEPQARARNMEREPMRERDRERESSADNRPGGWRDGERAAPEPARTPYGGRDSFGRDRGFGEERRERSGYGGRDGFRPAAEREGFGSRDSRGFGGRSFGDRDRDRDPPKEDGRPRERPKLNLLPRTLPREPEVPTKPADGAEAAAPAPDDAKPDKLPKPVPAEKVFGAAKPVDTAAKEREIEERLLKQGEESRRAVDEKERWGRRNDHSGDRRGGARRDDRDRGRDDRGRDSRSYNRDRRDYSKDGKDDRRDYSKDDRDRRDDRDVRDRRDDRDVRDRRDDRDRRDYRDDRDRRDYKDDRDRRDNRDDRDRRDYSGDRRSGSPRGRSRDTSRERPRRNGSDDRGRDDRRDRSRDRDVRTDRSRDGNDRSRDGNDRVDRSRDRNDRSDRSRDGNDRSRDRDDRDRSERARETNGRERDRADADPDRDRDEKPLPKMKEQEKPNFVASNKFSFLEDADDGGSD